MYKYKYIYIYIYTYIYIYIYVYIYSVFYPNSLTPAVRVLLSCLMYSSAGYLSGDIYFA